MAGAKAWPGTTHNSCWWLDRRQLFFLRIPKINGRLHMGNIRVRASYLATLKGSRSSCQGGNERQDLKRTVKRMEEAEDLQSWKIIRPPIRVLEEYYMKNTIPLRWWSHEERK